MAKDNKNLTHRINDEIYGIREVRLTGDGIEPQVLPLYEAKKIAKEMELDLVEINANARPPVLKIMNYEKWLYEQKKLAKKKKHNTQDLKEVQLSTNIASNDLNTKVNRAKEFIEAGHKVKVVLTMRGRELSRREESKRSLLEFIVKMDEVALPESNLRDEGNKCIVILKRK